MKAKALLSLFLALSLTGCYTERQCLQMLPRDTVTVKTITYRDTTIFVPIPGTDTVMVYGRITDTIYASSGTAHARTFIIRDTAFLNVWQSDTTLTVQLDSVIRELQIKKTEIVTVQRECKKTKFDRYLNKGIIIIMAVVLIFFLRLFKK